MGLIAIFSEVKKCGTGPSSARPFNSYLTVSDLSLGMSSFINY